MQHRKTPQFPKNTITVRWLISNLGVVFLVLLIVELSVIYTLQHYYYNSAEQYLTTKISSVTTVLTRYSQDTGSNFSADLRSTFENFSDKERMELMAINSKGRVTLTTSGFAPDTGRRCRTMKRQWNPKQEHGLAGRTGNASWR